MTVLDTFYILFKTNADDVKRGMDTVNKVAKETEKNLKNTNEQADTLGKTFVKMVEGGAELAGMMSAFNMIKAGVISQRDYNAQLYTTSTLYKQNAGALKEFAQAATQMGGTRGSAMSDLVGYSQLAQQRGLKYDPLQQMLTARARYQSAGPVAQGQMLTGPNAYYQDPGLQMMLQMNNKDFGALMNSKGVKAAGSLTGDQAKAAFESQAAGRELDASVGKRDTTIGTGLIPVMNRLIGVMSSVASSMGNSLTTALFTAGALILGKGLASGGLARGILGSLARGGVVEGAAGLGVGGMAGAGMAGAGALAAGAGTVAVGAAALGGGAAAGWYGANLFKPLIDKIYEDHTMTPKLRGLMAAKQASGDMNFWKSQGYSTEQAASILANMQAESGGNPNAVGDGGKAKGLFQWHKDRRDAIMKGTGIDVWNSSKQDPLNAAAWEMKNGNVGFDDKTYRSIRGANGAGAYFSSHFERPADQYGEMMRRGQSALGIAAGYQAPVTVGNANVTISAININAPGADAKQIAQHIKAATQGALSTIQAQADNGRQG